MDSDTTRKLTTIIMLILAVACIYYIKQIRDDRITIGNPQPKGSEDPVGTNDPTDIEEPAGTEDPTTPTVNPELDPENWDTKSGEAFFVEYRLQRDRVRASEVELINSMIENPNITAEGKKQAEQQLLNLIGVMEKEMLVENMLKAQGYKDAVFFIKDGHVNVVVQAVSLSEEQFMQIVEMVSNATGVSIENISVMEQGNKAEVQ